MSSSLFRQVTLYRMEERFNPSENRLTEILAAVLQRVPALARRLTLEWLNVEPSGDPAISTQVSTLSGGFVDAEIRYRDGSGLPLVVWIENKHGAGFHGDQVMNYQSDLTRMKVSEKSAVIVLAPSYAIPEGSPPARTHTWQTTARIAREMSQAKATGPVEGWLLAEFHRYLKEEGLTDTDPLRAEHALALSYFTEANSTLDRIVDLAAAQLAAKWGPQKDRNQRGLRWRLFSPAPGDREPGPSWGDAAFELTVRIDTDFLNDPRNGWAFFSGVTYYSSADAPTAESDQAWIAARADEGLRLVSDRWWRVFRVLYPDQLLSEPTLEKQAQMLFSWTLGTFRDLAENPPPPRPDQQ